MDRYSRLLLQFVHALEHGLDTVEVFVFSTRLTRITRELRKRNVDAPSSRSCNRSTTGRAARASASRSRRSTSIGAGAYLRSGATVVMISDGWDRGDPKLLATEMARLQRSCRRLIWLNPLLGAPGYQPLDAGHPGGAAVCRCIPANSQSQESGIPGEILSDMDDKPPVRRKPLDSGRHVGSIHMPAKPLMTDRGELVVNVGPVSDGNP